MEKRVGITTSTQSFGDNYGAILQACALSSKLKSLGYAPYIIRYQVEGEYERGRAPFMMRLNATLLNRNVSMYAKKTLILNRVLKRSAKIKFREFSSAHLIFYNEGPLAFDKLRQNPPDLDAFITGSDQVWNPVIHNNTNDPGYFLDFVPIDKRRIAYAPSIGVDHIPESCKIDLKCYLDKFHAISIRERSGADIIRSVCGIDVPVVLDPTLLLTSSEWDEFSQSTSFLPKEYILCYKFGKSRVMDATIKTLSKQLQLPVVAIPASPETKFKTDFRIGPGEFLSAIKNARIVCTDSFHASVFSIIYNKPFLAFPRHADTAKYSMNNRMTDLLGTFGLLNQYITEVQNVDYNWVLEVSYDSTYEIIERKRIESMNYLINSLEGIAL